MCMGVTAETILFYGISVRALGGKVTKERQTATRYDAITGEAKIADIGTKMRVEIGDYVLEALESEDAGKIDNDFDDMLEESPLERFQFDSSSYLSGFMENDFLDGVFIGVQVPFNEGSPIDDKLLVDTQETAIIALGNRFDCVELAKLHVIVNYS